MPTMSKVAATHGCLGPSCGDRVPWRTSVSCTPPNLYSYSMRLEVTRRTDLATRALIALAGGGRRKASDLAEALDTSPGFLSQAMTPMVNKGWVRSEPGRSGGYTAAVALEDVSVLDVVEAVEGPTDVTRCVLEDRACTGGGRCALHDAWAQARGHLLHDLAETPLSTIGSPR